MAGHNALSKRLLQRLDWIALAEATERRSKLLRAVSGSADCMTRSAVASKQRLAAFEILRGTLTECHDRCESGQHPNSCQAAGGKSRLSSVDRRLASAAQSAVMRSASCRCHASCSLV